MGLFQLGEFKLSSGQTSRWKIDCDFLTDNDLEAIAFLLAQRLPNFGAVEGVPDGGLRLADAMRHYSLADGPLLIVDDVLATGESMEKLRAGRRAFGAVIFARGKCPFWIVPLFQTLGA